MTLLHVIILHSTAMDPSTADEGPSPSRQPSSPASRTPVGVKGQVSLSSQRPKVLITPFHSSPIANAAFHSKRTATGNPLGSPVSFFLGTAGCVTTPLFRERPTAAGNSERQAHSSGSSQVTPGKKVQASPSTDKVNRFTLKCYQAVFRICCVLGLHDFA